ETRQLALALGRLLPAETTRISFYFRFTKPWGFEFYKRFRAEADEDRAEAMRSFYSQAAELGLAAESRSVAYGEIADFFRPPADDELPCRAALVLLDWSIVSAWLTSGNSQGVAAGSYSGHFCVLVEAGEKLVTIMDPDPGPSAAKTAQLEQKRPANNNNNSKAGSLQKFPVLGGLARQLPVSLFERARTSLGTDEDIIMVSWSIPNQHGTSPTKKVNATKQPCESLIEASYRGDLSRVRALLARGAAPGGPNAASDSVLMSRTTPLIVAAWRGHVQVVSLLLEARADPCEAQSGEGTPLWFAAEAGWPDIARELLQRGAAADMCDPGGRSPLWAAARHGHVEVLKILLDEGGRLLDAPAETGATPLFVAAERGHLNAVELLLERRASLQVENRFGATPLAVAAESGWPEVVAALLKAGASPGTSNVHRATPLHLAAAGGHCDCTRLLLDAAAEVDATNVQGATPLMLAAERDRQATVELLLARRADPMRRNASGGAAVELAESQGHQAMAQFLRGLYCQ
ncbi:unnamed protein product, partial [Polarella glacialis]